MAYLIKILLYAIIATVTLANVAIAMPTNLAPAGTATQSSTRAAGGAASRAIDGNTDGNFANNSVTHTNTEFQAWWQVDLGSIADLTTIDLYNRTDGPPRIMNRASNFHVFVSDVPFTSTTIAATQAQPGVLDLFNAPTMGSPTTLTVNRTGRYVRVQLRSTSAPLHMAEVEVLGTRSPEINIVSSESGAVADGGTDAQGGEPATTAKTVTYTINNTGTDTLNLTGTPTATSLVNVTAPVITAPVSATVAPGASTTFTVTYTPTLEGPFSFDLDVISDDADENPYDMTVSGTAAAGIVTFVITGVDGTYNIASTEPTLNTAINVNAGSGTSGSVSLRPGTFPITFTAPEGIGVESAQCSSGTSTLSADSKTGTIVMSSGAAVTCTITTRDSLRETVKQIGQFLETRSQLILQHQPDLTRRIDRLEGRYVNNGEVSGFGFTLKSDIIPFSAQIGDDDLSFSYSMRQSHAAGTAPILLADATSVMSSFGVTPTSYKGEDASAHYPNTSTTTVAAAMTTSTDAIDNSHYQPTPVSTSHFSDEQRSDVEKRPFDFWVQGQISKFEAGKNDAEGNFRIVHIGADYLVKPEVLLGLSLQGDWTNLDGENEGSETEGVGFLLAPYMTAKISERFYFDARAGWGQAYNDISPFGTYKDSFDSERWLASAALIGTWQLGNGLKITPEARLSYFKESSDAYVDSLNVDIPSVEDETGTFEFGPTFSQDFITYSGVYSPFLTVEGIWTFSQRNTADRFINQSSLADNGARARLETGIDFYSYNGSRFNFSANYDGIGDNRYSSWGLGFQLDYAF